MATFIHKFATTYYDRFWTEKLGCCKIKNGSRKNNEKINKHEEKKRVKRKVV